LKYLIFSSDGDALIPGAAISKDIQLRIKINSSSYQNQLFELKSTVRNQQGSNEVMKLPGSLSRRWVSYQIEEQKKVRSRWRRWYKIVQAIENSSQFCWGI